jgi:hypothetical protein
MNSRRVKPIIPLALLLIGLLLAAGAALGQEAEAERDPVTLYSHPTERYHVFIPPGWQDFSTPRLARMERGTTQITARSFPTADAASALAQTLAEFAPNLADLTPTLLDPVTLNNGTWQIALYPPAEAGALTGFIQRYEDATYTLLMLSGANSRPIFLPIPAEGGLSAAVEAAAALAGLGAASVTSAGEEAVEVVDQAYTPFTLTTESGEIEAWARTVGGNAFVLLGGSADDAAVFSIVLDFFITPETTGYLYLGVAVSAAILGLLVLSLILRARGLRADLRTLQQLGADSA